MAKKYYKTTFIVEVLSEDEPLADDISLGDINYECDEGACVGRHKRSEVVELTESAVAAKLEEFGSDASFFDLEDADG